MSHKYLPNLNNSLLQSSSSASVLFDFDACGYTRLLNNSIQSLSFNDELITIVDTVLDPVIAEQSFLPSTFTNPFKDAIVLTANTKVNQIKSAIIAEIDSLRTGCGRRLGAIELNEDRSQRMLQSDLRFSVLAASIQIADVVEFVSLCQLILHPIAYNASSASTSLGQQFRMPLQDSSQAAMRLPLMFQFKSKSCLIRRPLKQL